MTDNSKYEGKTAAELIEMLKAQEAFQGKQAEEIGGLRRAVQMLDTTVKDAQRKAAAKEEAAPVYRTVDKALADEVILSPQTGLGKVMDRTKEEAVQEAERRVTSRLEQKAIMDRQIESYMRSNPILQKWADVFSVAGAQIFNQNPNAPLTEILEGAKKATLNWLAEKGIKAEDDSTNLDRKRSGMTTSSGTGNRDTEGTRQREGNTDPYAGMEEDRANIARSIDEIKNWKSKRALPPRSR